MKKQIFLFIMTALFLVALAGCKSSEGITDKQRKQQDADKDKFQEEVFDEEQ